MKTNFSKNPFSKNEYIRREVAEMLLLPDRRIAFYSDQPGLLPVLKTKVGRGVARVYSKVDVVLLAVIKELSFFGLSLARLAEVVNFILSKKNEWWDSDKDEFKVESFRIWISRPFKEEGPLSFSLWNKETEHLSHLNPKTHIVIDIVASTHQNLKSLE